MLLPTFYSTIGVMKVCTKYLIGTFHLLDPDSGDTHTYSLWLEPMKRIFCVLLEMNWGLQLPRISKRRATILMVQSNDGKGELLTSILM